MKVNLGKRLHYLKAPKKCSKNKLILNLFSKPMETVKELNHLSSNVFCTFNLTFFTVNTLKGVSDSFVKQGTPVSSSTIPANPDSH